MSKIHFKIFTLFPELFPGALDISITGSALKKEIWSFEAINIRDYATDNHKTVDDTPYGGGAGMLLKPEVIASAFEKNEIFGLNSLTNNAIGSSARENLVKNYNSKARIIYLSPRGKLFNQKMARDFTQESEIAILCGRYEGVDQRIIDHFAIEEISIGDYVLSGGEIACYVFIDAILRNILGVLGKHDSLYEESFGSSENSNFNNLLEYPHYTKPSNWRGIEVPEILLSGHHKKIQEWRMKEALKITQKMRPDLLKSD